MVGYMCVYMLTTLELNAASENNNNNNNNADEYSKEV
jgi:hypothetical protein